VIIIKKLLILGALGASALSVNAQKADAATVKRTVSHNQGVSVYTNYENAGYTGQLLRMGDQVDVYDTKTDLAGNKWIKIGEGQWIMEEYTAPSDSTGSTSQSSSNYSSTGSTNQSSTYGSTSQSSSTYKLTSQSSTYGSTGQSSTSQSGSTYKSTSQSSTKTQNQQVSQSSTKTQTQKPKIAAGLSSSESSAKEWIAQRESGGSYTAQNGQYYGRYQLSRSYLNGDYSSANQEKVANNYVKNRYGSWSNAKSFWQTHGWY
jgi:hypothetical protein